MVLRCQQGWILLLEGFDPVLALFLVVSDKKEVTAGGDMIES